MVKIHGELMCYENFFLQYTTIIGIIQILRLKKYSKNA